jgi:hypothetical protein
MRRIVLPLVGTCCFLVLLLGCYKSVLFQGHQFGYRDAPGHFYPLYLRVQQEWSAGRWPLWDPGRNGGTPLLGNPTAAVLYPGKLIYALFPYDLAARLYVVAHTVLAFVGMLVLGRNWRLSGTGSMIGGLCYAFGAPVLFLYCNVIYLVGAAWIPWGLRAIDRLLRQRQSRGLVELAAVLALQVLGGEPEGAYLTALCGAGYAVGLAIFDGHRPAPTLPWPWVLTGIGIWVVGALGVAYARPAPVSFRLINGVVLASWVIAALVLVWRWRQSRGKSKLAPLLAPLAGACALAVALSAAQILPTLEFASQSRRASGDLAFNIYRFSLDPFRAVELLWPNVFGLPCPENQSWIQGVPRSGDHELWVDSLYVGGLALILGLSACGWRGGPAFRAWLTSIVVVGLLASFGKYASPLWWARFGPLASLLGPHDPPFGQPRTDGFLNDGAGSLYGMLTMLLPGFGAFRYPGKLLTLSAAALAVLAGMGWDRAITGESRGLRRLAWAGLGLSLVLLVAAIAGRDRAVACLTGRVPPDAGMGPSDIARGWAETQWALAQGSIVLAVVLTLTPWIPRRPRLAGILALIFLTADLTVANARLIWTVPQAEFDVPSEAARLIEASERSNPSAGPFRVHRMSGWYPVDFLTTQAPRRFEDLIAWDRATLQPLYGLPLRIEYCRTQVGSWELDEYAACFRPQLMAAAAGLADTLGIPAGGPLAYYPRRCFDIWGSRYFILPAAADWGSRERGYASFLDRTEPVEILDDAPYQDEARSEGETRRVRQDWQLRRNLAAYPRAWIVHYARVLPPANDAAERAEMIDSLAFTNDPIWNDPRRPVFDLHREVLIESDRKKALAAFSPGGRVAPSESVSVIRYEPQLVELKASLSKPGLVILADTYYPGWRLTIDEETAPIYRANRLMRAACVSAGEHRILFTYEPISFRLGAVISTVGLLAFFILGWRLIRNAPAPHAASG